MYRTVPYITNMSHGASQAAAVPANTSDPLLTNWAKLPSNPLSIEIPPGGTHAQFRDPVTAWRVSTNDLAGMLAGMNAAETVGAGSPQAPYVSVGGAGSNRSAAAQPSVGQPSGKPPSGSSGSSGSTAHGPAEGNKQVIEIVVGGRGLLAGNSSGGGGDGGDGSGGAEGELWMTAVGSLDDCLGAAALYVSSDQLRWACHAYFP